MSKKRPSLMPEQRAMKKAAKASAKAIRSKRPAVVYKPDESIRAISEGLPTLGRKR